MKHVNHFKPKRGRGLYAAVVRNEYAMREFDWRWARAMKRKHNISRKNFVAETIAFCGTFMNVQRERARTWPSKGDA